LQWQLFLAIKQYKPSAEIANKNAYLDGKKSCDKIKINPGRAAAKSSNIITPLNTYPGRRE